MTENYCCPLGRIYEEEGPQVIKAVGMPSGMGKDLAFVAVNRSPIIPGNVSSLVQAGVPLFSLMLLPVRHTTHTQATLDELGALRDLQAEMLEKMVVLYGDHDFMPFVTENPYAPHASIPEHMHRHLVPSPVNLRGLEGAFNQYFVGQLDRVSNHGPFDLGYFQNVADLLR